MRLLAVVSAPESEGRLLLTVTLEGGDQEAAQTLRPLVEALGEIG